MVRPGAQGLVGVVVFVAAVGPVSAQIDVTCSYLPRRHYDDRKGTVRRHARTGVGKYGRCTSFCGETRRRRVTARQHVKKGRQTVTVLGKLRRKLEQHGSDLGRQHLQSSLHQLYRVRTILVQPLPMGNELRRLPREQKILQGLVPPRCYSLQRRRSIERAINLGGRKLSSVPAKPFGFRRVRG
jgi:hypothetical protein